MHNGFHVGKKLLNDSAIPLHPIYSEKEIAYFNSKLTPLFEKQVKARRYVDALDIFKLGMLEHIFTPTLISLIFSIFEEPVLYHCHSYEIDGLNNKPHISGDNFLNGWHRDTDCKHKILNNDIQHVSLFIYLTEVGDNDGAFEVCNKKFNILPMLFKSSLFYKIVGKPGTSFLFNRTAVHRASPNISNIDRRVLKISFQDRSTPSKKLNKNNPAHDKRFKLDTVKNSLENKTLRYLFGDQNIARRSITSEDIHTEETIRPMPLSPYEIQYKMTMMQEFRGYSKDLIYMKDLILSDQ